MISALSQWISLERWAALSVAFQSTLSEVGAHKAAKNAYQVVLGMHCHILNISENAAVIALNKQIDDRLSNAKKWLVNDDKEAVDEDYDERCDEDGMEINEVKELNHLDKFKANVSAELLPLASAAWRYEEAKRKGWRYLVINLGFDSDAHKRAGLEESTKKFLAALVTSNSPDRFHLFWKAMIGESERVLPWTPPIVKGEKLSHGPSHNTNTRRCVRVLGMVHELHKAGYQRLRVLPFLSGSGCHWRAWMTYSENVAQDGYTLIDWDNENTGEMVAKYTSADENMYFGWSDSAGLSARALAQKFLDRFPALCARAQGLDWAYAGWLTDVLGQAERADEGGGLIYLIHDGVQDQAYMQRWQPPPPLRVIG